MNSMYSKINQYIDPSYLFFGTPSRKRESSVAIDHDPYYGYAHSSTWSNNNPSHADQPLRFIVIRHGERVDVIYGAGWTQRAFPYGQYHPFDANMPPGLPYRANWQDYDVDTPLTSKGLSQSWNVGNVLTRYNLPITSCYSSPAFRSIQTADKILEGMGRKALVPIRIEVGLFECTSWYTQSPITFMSDQELLQGGINIDQSYHSQISDLKLVENEYQYYDRSRDTIKKIIKLHKKTGGNILLVAHAPSLEVLTRHLMNGQPRPERLAELASKVDFCSMTIVERESSAKPWHFRYSLDEKLSEDQQKLEQSRSASTLARSNSSSQLAPSPPPQQQQYTSMVQQPQTYATYTPKQPPSFYQPTPLNYHFHPQMENYPPYFDFA